MSDRRSRQRWDVALRERIETGLEAWGHIVAQHRWSTIVIMLLIALAFASQLPKVELETSTDSMLLKDDPARVVYNEFRKQFGREEPIIVAIRPPEVFDLRFLEKLRALHEELEERVPNLDEVLSLVNARETRGEGNELIVRELLEDWPQTPQDLASLRQRVLANPLYRNLLISDDAQTTTILIKTSAYSSEKGELDDLAGFDEPATDDPSPTDEPAFITGRENEELMRAVNEVVTPYRSPDFEVYMAGGPVTGSRLVGEMRDNITLFSALSMAAVAALLFALFRRVFAVFLPLLVISLSIISTFGVMGLLGVPLGLPTQILPSFLLAVGVGATVHILVIFFQGYDRGASPEDAIAEALGHSGLAVIMTALTTAGGLVSFVVAELAPVAVLGMFAPAGVMLGLVYCLVLLPATLTAVPLRRRRVPVIDERPGWIERFLVWNGDQCVKYPWTVVICMSAILIMSIIGATRLTFIYDPVRWFPEADPIRTDTELIDRELRGSVALEITVDTGEENGLHDPKVLNGLDQLRVLSESFQGEGGLYVGKTVSIADTVKEIHQALNENRSEYYTIPEDRQLIAQELLLFENSGSDDLEDLVDSQFQKARFTLKLPYVPPLLFDGFIRRTVDSFRQVLGDDVKITPTGFCTVITRALNALSTSMIRSYTIALMIITPLMFLLLGNLRGGTAAMVPNLAPIIVTLGVMGWTGIPLGIFTLLIGSIAIGLAVDDTIHFMHNFRKYYEKIGDVRLAVRETLRTTGHALLVASVVLSLAFFIYMFASLSNLVIFGLLTGFTIATAFIADITVSPALMALSIRGDHRATARAERRRQDRTLAQTRGAHLRGPGKHWRRITSYTDALRSRTADIDWQRLSRNGRGGGAGKK
jgi:predicted RND superfamily exporter protein